MPLLPSLRRALHRGADPTDPATQEFLTGQADMGAERVERYRRFQNLYDGEHRLQLTRKQRLWLEDCGIPFGENFVATVVDKLAARERIEGFQVQDDQDSSSYLSTTVWPRNQGEQLQLTVHTKAAMLGDAFVIVTWDEAKKLPVWHYNRPHIILPTYSEETGQLVHLSKVWASSAVTPTNPSGQLIQRMNLFYPDRVEKYFAVTSGDGAQWLPHLDEDTETWPIWWTNDRTQGGDPLGINVFHFRHRPLGENYGRSRVKRAAPFQAELHKQALDLFDVMDEQGWKQRWAAGIAEGETMTVKPGDIVTARNADARFGEFTAEDPAALAEAMLGTLKRMAAATQTPLHDLTNGQPPSGESRKTAESGLVEEAIADMASHTPSWAGAGRMSLRLAAVFGDGKDVPSDAEVDVTWDDPQTRNEKDEAEVAVIYSELGVSNHTLQRRLGFDPDEEATLRKAERPPAPPPGAPVLPAD